VNDSFQIIDHQVELIDRIEVFRTREFVFERRPSHCVFGIDLTSMTKNNRMIRN